MQFIARDVGGTIRWRAPRRSTAVSGSDSTPTVIIYNEGGGVEIASQNATLHSTNTTTSAAVAAGDSSLTATATTGIERGDELYLGPNAAGQAEFVKVKGVNTTTKVVTLAHPTLYAYASAVSLEGTYQSVAITAAQVPESYTNWRAVFSWVLAGVQQAPGIVRFDVIRHWISHQPCTMSDIRAFDAKVTERVASTFDWEYQLDAALNDVLREANQTLKAGAILAEDDWRELVALKLLSAFVGPALGAKGEAYRNTWSKRYQAFYAVYKPQLVSDDDEDGAISPPEKGRGIGGELHRG